MGALGDGHRNLLGRDAARLTPDILWAGLRTRIGTRAMRRRAFMQLVMPDAYLSRAAPTLEEGLEESRALISQLSEVGVYTVKNGKIVREEFSPRGGG